MLEMNQHQPPNSAADKPVGDFIRGISHPGGTICDVRKEGQTVVSVPDARAYELRGIQHHWGSSGRELLWIEDLSRGANYRYNRQTLSESFPALGAVELAARFVVVMALLPGHRACSGSCGVDENRMAWWLCGAESGKKSSAVSLVCPIGTRYAFLFPALDNGVQQRPVEEKS